MKKEKKFMQEKIFLFSFIFNQQKNQRKNVFSFSNQTIFRLPDLTLLKLTCKWSYCFDCPEMTCKMTCNDLQKTLN